jgi:DNA processing protein
MGSWAAGGTAGDRSSDPPMRYGDEPAGPDPGVRAAGAATGRADREPLRPRRIAPDEREAWILLNAAEGVGPVSFARLVAGLGDARTVLAVAASPGGLAHLVAASCGPDGGSPTLTRAAARAIAQAAGDPRRHLEQVRRAGVEAVTLADAIYPARLRRIELPPPVLFMHGNVGALDRPHAVAVVGTRRPTAVGRATAGRIADAVAALGATVVSGLALGIDAAAHAAALRSGRPTVAVIGGGHAHLYPAGHRALARAIAAAGGAVVSEFAPDTIPTRGTFPRRNRIISGLADATVVVEAGARSGALTTAAWALEQGRGLHIVPGRLDDPAVAGSLAFLREAGPEARVVAGVPELLEDLDLLPDRARAGPTRSQRRLDAARAVLPAPERLVANAILAGAGSVDELVAVTGLPGATVLGTLTGLEVKGLVIEVFGSYRAAGGLAAEGRGPRAAPSSRRAAHGPPGSRRDR